MPTYEFTCKKCGTAYEEFAAYDAKGKYPKVICPKCGSKAKIKNFSTFAVTFGNPMDSDKWRNSHDYRYKTKLPQAVAEREAAQKASKMGSNPYGQIDDISSGKHFGDVK